MYELEKFVRNGGDLAKNGKRLFFNECGEKDFIVLQIVKNSTIIVQSLSVGRFSYFGILAPFVCINRLQSIRERFNSIGSFIIYWRDCIVMGNHGDYSHGESMIIYYI